MKINKSSLRPRSPAGWCAALGITLLAFAVSGALFTRSYDAVIADGTIYHARDPFGREWTFASQGISRVERDSNFIMTLALLPALNGRRQPMLTSEHRESTANDIGRDPVTTSVAGVRQAILQEIHLTFTAVTPGVATVHLTFVPFGSWGWAGAGLIAIGGLFAAVARTGLQRGALPALAAAFVASSAEELDAAAEQAIDRWRGRTARCPNCAAELEPDANFCSSCGRRLAD